MKIRTFVIGYVFALAIFLFAQHRSPLEPTDHYAVVDLTHAIGSAPANESGKISAHPMWTAAKDSAHDVSDPASYGTRIAAPAHLVSGLWTVDQIPVERLVAPLALLDVRAKAARNPDYQVTVDDISDWEQLHGHIPQGAIVIARTGWESRWTSAKEYRNADASGTMHFPGYSTETARFLIEGRNVIGLGIDTLSVDFGRSKDFPVNKYTLSHSVYQLENVANLSQAPESGATLAVAPAKLQGGSAAPVRLLAMVK